jgi:uncharacterized protein
MLSGTGAAAAGADMRPESAARITLRPIANPLPLGFLALAIATLLVSALQLQWLDPVEERAVGLALLSLVVPAQAAASILSYLGRDVVGGTGLGILAGTWLSVTLVTLTSPPAQTSRGLALLLAMAALVLLIPAAGAATGKLVLAAVLVTAAARFGVTAGHEWTGAAGWQVAAGVTGLVLCVIALYAALAMMLEDALRRTVLPLFRRDAGWASLDGDFDAQVRRIEGEAGVREQL